MLGIHSVHSVRCVHYMLVFSYMSQQHYTVIISLMLWRKHLVRKKCCYSSSLWVHQWQSSITVHHIRYPTLALSQYDTLLSWFRFLCLCDVHLSPVIDITLHVYNTYRSRSQLAAAVRLWWVVLVLYQAVSRLLSVCSSVPTARCRLAGTDATSASMCCMSTSGGTTSALCS